jgi:multidrug efflux pump subunit AcrA (membrane-fusion protein)
MNKISYKTAVLILAVCLFGASSLIAQQPPQLQEGRALDPQKMVVLSAAVNGIIAEITREPQDFVKKDDLLVQLDCEQTELQIKGIQLQIEMKRTIEIKEAEVKYEYARDNLAIVEKLYNKQIGGSAVASEKEMKEAIQSAQITKLGIEKIKKDIERLELELKQAEKMLEQHSLRAPMDGVIVSLASVDEILQVANLKVKPSEVGETVQVGKPIIAMMKVDKLRLRKTLPITQQGDVRLGQSVDVFIEDVVNKKVTGQVVYISPTINSATQTFEVKVEIDNPLVENYQKLSQSDYRYLFRPFIKAYAKL